MVNEELWQPVADVETVHISTGHQSLRLVSTANKRVFRVTASEFSSSADEVLSFSQSAVEATPAAFKPVKKLPQCLERLRAAS